MSNPQSLEAHFDNIHIQQKPKTKRITQEFLNKLLSSDFQQYYKSHPLNDVLYLQMQDFAEIENLDTFTGLKTLYLNGNQIEEIKNLGYCTQLKALYLQENMIKKIENLENLENLSTLNISYNMITKIEKLGNNQKLHALHLTKNSIGVGGLSDIEHLKELKSLATLDLSDNFIDTPDYKKFIAILQGIPKLSALYLRNNPIIDIIPNYRKVMVYSLPGLTYLDDKPVFDEEKRFAKAFMEGGVEAEKREMQLFKEEEWEKHRKQHEAFKAKYFGKKDTDNDEPVGEDLESIATSKLETYYSNQSSEEEKE